jgi:hypothetical protein
MGSSASNQADGAVATTSPTKNQERKTEERVFFMASPSSAPII